MSYSTLRCLLRTLLRLLSAKSCNTVNASSGYVAVDYPFDNNVYQALLLLLHLHRRRDARVSTNPAMQLLDYLTSKRYGKGLSIDQIFNLDSFIQTAIACDTRSDVTVVVPSTTTAVVGDVYKYVQQLIYYSGTINRYPILLSMR